MCGWSTGCGLLRADQPWSGRIQDRAPNLAATAHTTWFTRPGMYPLRQGAGSGPIGANGTAVTYVDDASGDFTTVVELLFGAANTTHTVLLKPLAEVKALRLYASQLDPLALSEVGADCEACKPAPLMARQPDLVPDAAGAFTLLVRAGYIYTATTMAAPASRDVPALPPAAPPAFPLPLISDFGAERTDTIPRFFNNYEGSFSIATDEHGRKALRQWVFAPPMEWHGADKQPLALVALG